MNNLSAVLIAGGRGTRSLEPNRPKILQKVGGVTLLEIHLKQLHRSGIANVVLSLGFKSNEVIDFVSQLDLSADLIVKSLIEPEQLGTINAMRICRSELNSKYCLILLGDILVDCDYSHLLNYWTQNTQAKVCVVVHPNLHPQASDRLINFGKGKPLQFIQKNQEYDGGGEALALAGIFLIETDFLKNFLDEFELGDFSQELIKYALVKDELFQLNSSFHFADTGTPERLSRAKLGIENGSVLYRGKSHKGAIFIDRDGTLLPDVPVGRKAISPEEIEESTVNAIAYSNRMGVPIFVVTNQPAISKGFICQSDVIQTHVQLQNELRIFSALIDEFIFCPHHPEIGFEGEVKVLKVQCLCRKPNPGMFNELATRHSLDEMKCFVIGDSIVDMAVADAIGAQKILVKHGDNSVARAIHTSVEFIRANY